MDSYAKAAMERAMKVQDVMLQAMAKKITWWQAAEILGISDRHMRRWRERYVEEGYNGLFDRRRGRPSRRRVAVATVEKVLALYREKYFDLNVQHFHEKLGAEHGIELSYTWVKQALQGAGLVARGRKRGVHRKRRARRPLPGMLLHIDGSRHRWFQDERWYDLIVILDDATSEIYYAQLVEEESTATVMAGLKEVIERKGVFCALYSDRGSHFWLTPKVGGKVDYQRRTQVGRALRELGVQMIPAYSPQARGRSERNFCDLARTTAAGVAAASDRDAGGRQPVSARVLRRRVQPPFSGRSGATWKRFCALPEPRSGADLLAAVRTHREPRQHGELSESELADRAGTLASHVGGLPGDGASAPGWNSEPDPRTALLGTIHSAGHGHGGDQHGNAPGGGKAAPRKSHKADFPSALGNPAKYAGFPLSHHPSRGCCLIETGHITCYKKRTF